MLNNFFLADIIQEAKKDGLPIDKKRAIIREYLQCQFLYFLYSQKESEKLSLIGGTALRLLRNLDRFSEDIDFDNLGLGFGKIKKLFERCLYVMQKEGFETEFSFKKMNNSGIGKIKFVNLLYKTGISTNPKEKLMIKLDYTTPIIKSKQEVITLSRFGFIQNIITASQESLLIQKAKAILTRKDPQARDYYDFVWLLSYNIEPDVRQMKLLGVKDENELWQSLLDIYNKRIKSNLQAQKKKLLPFLIHPENIRYLEIFENLLKTKLKANTNVKKEKI